MLTEEKGYGRPAHERVHLPKPHIWKMESAQCHLPWGVTASESTYGMRVVLHSIALKEKGEKIFLLPLLKQN